jgi:hypothetical protein
MDEDKVCGLHGEGRILCGSCAGRIYGTSLEKYVKAGDLQVLGEEDGEPYAAKGLLCDECSQWIFRPDETEEKWWRTEPGVAEHLRLLAPFATFLERLGVDGTNLRVAAAIG